ncbi:hypothetical protein ACWENQ_08140 [Nonomuraea sp. NPDC004354]
MTKDLSALDRLTALVPPPAQPVFGTRTWDDLFDTIGFRLPADCIAFTERYGSCEFAEWLYISDPRSVTDLQLAHMPEWMDYYRDLREDSPEDFKLAMWPEPGGFLQWGSTIDGDAMGWMTVGKPEEWPVMVVPRHYDEDSPIPETMTEWLLEWASGNRFGSWIVGGPDSVPLTCTPSV